MCDEGPSLRVRAVAEARGPWVRVRGGGWFGRSPTRRWRPEPSLRVRAEGVAYRGGWLGRSPARRWRPELLRVRRGHRRSGRAWRRSRPVANHRGPNWGKGGWRRGGWASTFL
eukprot:3896288-Prymnesium_polylepis.1